MNLLSPHFGVFFWQFITIFLVLVILKLFAFGPISKSLEARKKSLDESLANAKEVENKLKYIDDLKAQTEKEVAIEKKRMLEHIESLRTEMMRDIKVEVEKERKILMANVQNELDDQRRKFDEECNIKISNLMFNYARKFLTRGTAEVEKQNFFLNEVVNEYYNTIENINKNDN